MNQDNRVLQRMGARELRREEIERITGGIITLTIVCTNPNPRYPTTDSDHEGCP